MGFMDLFKKKKEKKDITDRFEDPAPLQVEPEPVRLKQSGSEEFRPNPEKVILEEKDISFKEKNPEKEAIKKEITKKKESAKKKMPLKETKTEKAEGKNVKNVYGLYIGRKLAKRSIKSGVKLWKWYLLKKTSRIPDKEEIIKAIKKESADKAYVMRLSPRPWKKVTKTINKSDE